MIITQTPLRISFAGGGTDFSQYYHAREGLVVSAAIDKAAFVIVTERYDDKIYVNYSRKEIVDRVDQIQHELVRESMKLVGIINGVEVTLLSDVPSGGSGLGSSSSFTVGLLNALHQYLGEQVSPDQLAEEACEVEISRCGKPIGKQDQYIAAFGGVVGFTFRPDDSVSTERFGLSPSETRQLSSTLFLFYSNQERKAETILSEQNRRTSVNLERLDRIRELAYGVREAIRNRNFHLLGDALNQNWQWKKGLASEISNGRIDEMHATAMAGGAGGAKLCGAGGGGFLLAYCPADRQHQFLIAMKDYRRMPIALERDGSKVIFNYRRSSWK